jgi:integrase
MPRKYELSWDAKNRRWLKEYRGKKYSVSCRQLYVPETKEASYQAANDWWTRKRAEIDLAGRAALPPPPPFVDVLGPFVGDPAVFQDPDKALEYAFGRIMTRRLEQLKREQAEEPDPEHAPYDPQDQIQQAHQLALQDFLERHVVKGEPLSEELRAALPPARLLQIEGGLVGTVKGDDATPADRRISHHRGRWQAEQSTLVEAGGLSPGRASNQRILLGHFVAFAGEAASVDVITAEVVQNYYVHCLGRVKERMADPQNKAGWGREYAKKVFGTARGFIHYLVEQGLIAAPANLDSRKLRFGAAPKAVPTWTVEEFQKVLGAATGQLRLHLLLMANCGMTQVDVSELRDDEVDWQRSRIIRKRSKTADQKNVPTVEYPLWPRTFELLTEYRSGGERVLLTKRGHCWVRSDWKDGRQISCDSIASVFLILKNRIGFSKPLKQLRKTAASLLDRHPEYGRYAQLFLGHAPRSVADKSYVKPSQDRFDEAVKWLGQQFGMIPADEANGGERPKAQKRRGK